MFLKGTLIISQTNGKFCLSRSEYIWNISVKNMSWKKIMGRFVDTTKKNKNGSPEKNRDINWKSQEVWN